MIQIINGRLYYFGEYGNLFIDITDKFANYCLDKQPKKD